MYEVYQQRYLIRDWQPGDRHSVAEVIAQVLGEYGIGWEPTIADRDVLEVEASYLATGGEFWVVAPVASPGQILGSAAYYPLLEESGSPRGVEIRKMYLLPQIRGQGLGRYLLHRLEQRIEQRGFEYIRIETAGVLTAAVRLYEGCGYLPNNEIETPRCDRAYCKRLVPPTSQPQPVEVHPPT